MSLGNASSQPCSPSSGAVSTAVVVAYLKLKVSDPGTIPFMLDFFGVTEEEVVEAVASLTAILSPKGGNGRTITITLN